MAFTMSLALFFKALIAYIKKIGHKYHIKIGKKYLLY